MLTLNKITIKITLFLSLFLLVISVNSFASVNKTNEFYVNDYANLLDTDTENYIISTNKLLNAQTGAQIVVVTVPNLEGKSLEEYATELFRKFGIGDKTKNNGVLMLLALEEREFRIEVGYGLEGILPDGKTGRIQDEYIIPFLKNNNWNEGIRNGYSKILEEVSKEYRVDVGEINAIKQANSLNKESQILGKAIWEIFIIIIFIVLYIIIRKNGGSGRGGFRGGYYGGGGHSSFGGGRGSFGGGGRSGGGGSSRGF